MNWFLVASASLYFGAGVTELARANWMLGITFLIWGLGNLTLAFAGR